MKALIALIILYVLIPLSWAKENVDIHLFWSQKCPHCHHIKAELEKLDKQDNSLNVILYQLDNSKKNKDKLLVFTKEYQLRYGVVPTTFIGAKGWVGFSPQILKEIKAQIENWQNQSQECQTKFNQKKTIIEVPFWGEINLHNSSFWFSTFLIAMVDGFNPCSLWVLTLLMGIIIGTKSRKKIILVGLSFLLTTAFVYGLFIAGIVTSIHFLAHISWIQYIVALFALVFAIVNIKDYFWYKKGLSFTIPKKFQPKIYRNFKALSKTQASSFALLGMTILMAIGIALVELPCTAGFPVIWGQLVIHHNITGNEFLGALGLYILIYLIDELIIFTLFVITLEASQLQEKQGRFLKLLSGIIMFFIAMTLFFHPALMENIVHTLILFLFALMLSILIHKLQRDKT